MKRTIIRTGLFSGYNKINIIKWRCVSHRYLVTEPTVTQKVSNTMILSLALEVGGGPVSPSMLEVIEETLLP